jgi:hypothetical protein
MHQPDEVNVSGGESDGKFTPHPAGTFPAVCVDVINLGKRVSTYEGKVKVAPKLALVFRTGEPREDGTPFDVAAEFTASMFDRATLRHFLEGWRGKAYTEEQVTAGVPVHKLAGQPALISVIHATSKQGRTYARISGAMALPKGMTPPAVSGYERPDYWAERKKAYADELARHEAANAPAAPAKATGFGAVPQALEDSDDDLPF